MGTLSPRDYIISKKWVSVDHRPLKRKLFAKLKEGAYINPLDNYRKMWWTLKFLHIPNRLEVCVYSLEKGEKSDRITKK